MKDVSQRKYAALIGITHTAVAKAVKNGYIKNGWNDGTKKINVEIANKEWGDEIKSKRHSQSNTAQSDENAGSISGKPLSEGLSFTEARRRKEIYNAELSRIEALKEQGAYIEKQVVYNQLFNYGKYIKTAFLAIPDRAIDNILAAKTRNESHQILLNEIRSVLEMLSTPPKIDNVPNDKTTNE